MCVCVCECVFSHTREMSLSYPRASHFPRATQEKRVWSLCFFRFGVIHSVFTNLLLWANSVLNESKHQLNEHKERLITLGFGNITIGEEALLLLAPGPQSAT